MNQVYKNKMNDLCKIMSVFLLSLVLCPSASASWTRYKKPLEKEFKTVAEEYFFWKRNYDKQEQKSKDSTSYLRRLREEKKEALNNNPNLKAKYDNWREINNLFIRKHTFQQQYESALKKAIKSVREMKEALNKVNNMEVRYMGLLHGKKDILQSLE